VTIAGIIPLDPGLHDLMFGDLQPKRVVLEVLDRNCARKTLAGPTASIADSV
jgi:hypothetical protein